MQVQTPKETPRRSFEPNEMGPPLSESRSALRRVTRGTPGRQDATTPLRTGTPGRQSIDGDSARELQEYHEDSIKQWLQMVQQKNKKLSEDDAWSNKLIEFFDMRALTENGRINYIRAASHLHGSVRVYKSRVEYLKNETNKCVSGMNRNRPQSNDDLAREDMEGPDEYEVTTRPRKPQRKNAPNIFATAKKLQMSSESLVCKTDPLFRQTQLQFDKGGYSSLLLNIVSPDMYGRLSFEDMRPHHHGLSEEEQQRLAVGGDNEYIEVDLESYYPAVGSVNLRDFALCPGLNLVTDAAQDPTKLTEEEDEEISFIDEGEGVEEGDDMEDAGGDVGDVLGDLDMEGDGGNMSIGAIDLGDTSMGAPDALEEDVGPDADVSMVDDLEDVFQQISLTAKNTNWKYNILRKSREEKGSLLAVARPRTKRTAHEIDFEPEDWPLAKKVFTKETNPDRIRMQDEEMLPLQQLPLESMDARDFTRLYLRPDLTSRAMRQAMLRIAEKADQFITRRTATAATAAAETIGDFDDPFAGEAAAAQEIDNIVNDDNFAATDEDDDVELPMQNDVFDAGFEVEERPHTKDLTVAGGPTLKVLQRNVDIRKLKTNMWKNIEPQHDEMKLTQVIKKTNDLYNRKEKSDLVSPLYFLNLLHLANETGIGLSSVEGFKDVMIRPSSA